MCRRVRQVVEPDDGELDGKNIYTVATVFEEGSETGDGMGHSRRPIQKLLDSPTLAARDARRQKTRTPTSTEAPTVFARPKSHDEARSREEAMADAMFKMHQEKLKTSVSSQSVMKVGGAFVMRGIEQHGKGLKRPAINIRKAGRSAMLVLYFCVIAVLFVLFTTVLPQYIHFQWVFIVTVNQENFAVQKFHLCQLFIFCLCMLPEVEMKRP